jgi:FtsP/CotA-like multicopper oxidase with cupredoxin domain
MGVGTTDTINGRIDFHSGFSENPVIGSTEDWFLINAFPYGHPMHIHLINFQVIKVFRLLVLKTATAACSYYEIDYVLEALDAASDTDAGVSDIKAKVYGVDENGDQTVDYNYTCNNFNAIKTNGAVLKQLSLIFPENEIDENRVSGLDLFAQDEEGKYKYLVDGEGNVSPKVGYSKWKDTVYIDAFKVLQCRTRWAKPEYNEEVDKENGSYFHVPADQMREYPGYVYHCHILPHEDNEMMRPIMLQMPDDGRVLKSPCPQLKWEDKVQCINKRCKTPMTA